MRMRNMHMAQQHNIMPWTRASTRSGRSVPWEFFSRPAGLQACRLWSIARSVGSLTPLYCNSEVSLWVRIPDLLQRRSGIWAHTETLKKKILVCDWLIFRRFHVFDQNVTGSRIVFSLRSRPEISLKRNDCSLNSRKCTQKFGIKNKSGPICSLFWKWNTCTDPTLSIDRRWMNRDDSSVTTRRLD